MKSTFIIASVFIGRVLSQASSLQPILQNLETTLRTLNTTVGALNGTSMASFQALTDASKGVEKSFQDGITKLASVQPIALQDTGLPSLTPINQDLRALATDFFAKVVQKKGDMDKLGVTRQEVEALGRQKKLSNDFNVAAATKLPDQIQQPLNQSNQELQQAYDRTISALGGPTNSTSGSSGALALSGGYLTQPSLFMAGLGIALYLLLFH